MTSQHSSECNFVINLKKKGNVSVNVIFRQRSRNDCRCGKGISIKYSQRVLSLNYAARNAHASCNIFLHITS